MYEYKCDIRRVVDGDTVDVDIDLGFGVWIRNERVRLYGVDTPESRTRDLDEKKYGILAKEYVKAALSNGAILRTHKDKSGKFGRVLGDFIIYDRVEDRQNSLNTMLVRDHHAVEYTGQSKELIAEKHIANRALVKEFLAK